jgi:hypothetical protein
MKINFFNRLEAIDWIAKYSEDEGQFEVLREQLTFNEIYSGSYYLILEESKMEVVLFAEK